MITLNILNIFIIPLICIVSFIALRKKKVMERCVFKPDLIVWRGEYDRYILSGLVHSGLVHLLLNMALLFFFGNEVIKYLTKYDYNWLIENFGENKKLYIEWLFLTLYFSAEVVCNIPTYIKHKEDINYSSLGASGAVTAVIFSYLIFVVSDNNGILFTQNIKNLICIFIVSYLLYCWEMMKEKTTTNINHSAHLFGALFGIIFAFLIKIFY